MKTITIQRRTLHENHYFRHCVIAHRHYSVPCNYSFNTIGAYLWQLGCRAVRLGNMNNTDGIGHSVERMRRGGERLGLPPESHWLYDDVLVKNQFKTIEAVTGDTTMSQDEKEALIKDIFLTQDIDLQYVG